MENIGTSIRKVSIRKLIEPKCGCWRRAVEVLKQGQYQPMAVEQQVMIIYAVTNGLLDDVPVAQVRDWERGFHEYMATSYPQVADGLRQSRDLSKELEADLRSGIDAYKQIAGAPSETATAAQAVA
jgi:F-type H+-transporting ATPase subunit alpha